MVCTASERTELFSPSARDGPPDTCARKSLAKRA
jgi:hypothetical protein